MKRTFRVGLAAFGVALLLGAVVAISPVSAENLKFAVSKPGGAWYPIGTAIQKLMKDDYGDNETLDIGGGTATNIQCLIVPVIILH